MASADSLTMRNCRVASARSGASAADSLSELNCIVASTSSGASLTAPNWIVASARSPIGSAGWPTSPADGPPSARLVLAGLLVRRVGLVAGR